MQLNTFNRIGNKTAVNIPISVLSSLPCGLFRASLAEAYELLPELAALYDSIPKELNKEDYEIDIKIHMLMKGQWPCIPNWHCDNVPRDENGITSYVKAVEMAATAPKMLLWVSGTPCTQFLSRSVQIPNIPQSHAHVAQAIKLLVAAEDQHEDKPLLTCIEPQQWITFDALTPHRGMQAQQSEWRIFARLTHKSILPTRPKVSVIRRHCQVYLDSNEFTW